MSKKNNKFTALSTLTSPYNYSIFHDFIESYLPSGFLNINEEDPVMKALEKVMTENDQMLIVMDLTEVKMLYTSKQSIKMLGVDPDNNTPLEMLNRVHPDDLERFGMGRAKLMNLDKDLLLSHKGSALLSTNIRMRKPDQSYVNHLFQCYMFYSPFPHKSVYYVQVNTNIDCYPIKKGSFHYYVGNDISLFRFPDAELLNYGHDLTSREFEILKLVAQGLTSSEIARNLFLSLNTVNTHRRNILEKYKKPHISDVVFDLMSQGLL